ncbi:hypothetical protein [Nibribacter koreensis]|uniref:hypothetical protein n=1 Tax=Nibribacter koreensis TaxID=1084519 RepID=UPI0031E5E8F5
MRTFFNTLLAILFVLMILNIMFWVLAYASGHQVPASTNIQTGITLLALAVSTILVFFLRRRYGYRKY